VLEGAPVERRPTARRHGASGLACRVIATEHTHPPSQTLSGLWQRLRRMTYPRAARVVALTRGTADWIEQHVPGSRLAVIPNPVHWPLPRAEPVLTPVSGDGRKRLLAVGRLHADKGFDLLIQAFATLAPSHPDWATRQPFMAVLQNDHAAVAKSGERGMMEIVLATNTGMPVPQYTQRVDQWLQTARHPRTKLPYDSMTYVPMRELLDYLRAHGFKTYIVSGGETEFMRAWTQKAYGIRRSRSSVRRSAASSWQAETGTR